MSHPRHAMFWSVQVESHGAMHVHPCCSDNYGARDSLMICLANGKLFIIVRHLFRTTATTISPISCDDERPTKLIACVCPSYLIFWCIGRRAQVQLPSIFLCPEDISKESLQP